MDAKREVISKQVAAKSSMPLIVAVAGATHAILFLVGVWLLDQASLPTDRSDEALADYLAGNAAGQLSTVGLNVAPFAGIALLWFVSAVRTWVGPLVTPANQIFLSVQGLSAAIYAAVMFVSAAALASPLISPGVTGRALDISTLLILPQFSATLMLVFGVRCAAMVAIATSRLGLETGLFPRWVAYLGFVAGLALFLSGPLSDALILVFPIWLLLLSATLIVVARRDSQPRGIRA